MAGEFERLLAAGERGRYAASVGDRYPLLLTAKATVTDNQKLIEMLLQNNAARTFLT